MENNNFWGMDMDSHDELKYTDNIHKIMDEQCNYLYQYTQGKVFAIFGEIKLDGSLIAVARAMSNMFRGVSGISGIQETVAEVSTKELIDANSMYYEKSYGFEICTEKYRFRLFELKLTPVYPVEIIVDEGICKNIGTALGRIAISTQKINGFIINDEAVFCDVLQKILQDKKVRYIISELKKRVQEDMKEDVVLPNKVILCEGKTDEVILQAIAQKLGCKVTIVVAEGKYSVPKAFDMIRGKNTKSSILIIVDSDEDEENTKRVILEKIGSSGYELAITNNSIEDWFASDITGFSKLKLMQSIGSIIDAIDFEEVSKKHESFAKVLEFMRK